MTVVRQRCDDPTRHEHGAFDCPHRGYGPEEQRSLQRWTTVDGCTGETCMECFFDLGVAQWQDLCRIAGLDPDGIPWDSGSWTEGDRATHVSRVLAKFKNLRPDQRRAMGL